MLGAALSAGARSGPVGRMIAYGAGRAAKKVMKRYGMKALGGAAAAGAAVTGYRSMAATQRRATARSGVKRVMSDLGGTKKKLRFGGTSRRVTIPGDEYQSYKMAYGRKRPMTVKTLSKVTTQRRIYRFQNIAPMDRGANAADRGAYMLNTIVVASLAPTTPYWKLADAANGSYAQFNVVPADKGDLKLNTAWLGTPINLFLLNGTRDRVSNGNAVGYRLYIKNDDPGSLSFQSIQGVRPDGDVVSRGVALSEYWNQEYSSGDFGGFTADEKTRYIQNDWYDIKLCLRNAASQRTWYEVSVVSFAEEWLDPLASPGGDDQVRERHALWYGITRKNANHPLQTDKNYAAIKKKIVVHKSIRVHMDANLTTQTDTSPNIKVVKLFYRDGTVNDYAKSPNTDVVQFTTADQLLNPNVYESVGVLQTNYETIPKPRARKWLMITAFDPSIAAVNATASNINPIVETTAWDLPATNPSYDIVIRKKETRFPDFTS